MKVVINSGYLGFTDRKKIMDKKLSPLRKDSQKQVLRKSQISQDPIRQFEIWFNQAIQAGPEEHNAMSLATVDIHGTPSVRMVLLKGYDNRGFVFFSNYLSRKGQEIGACPRVALLLWWGYLERQIRIEGRVEKISEQDSDIYFATRPRGSKLAAWASPQSQIIPGAEFLNKEWESLRTKYGNRKIPRPPHWGGYRVIPSRMEFWQGRPNRMHDRLCYSLEPDGTWKLEMLAP